MHALAAEAASKSEGHGVAEPASDDSVAASQDEASDESVASSAYDSDATDLFHLEVEPSAIATWETLQDKDRRVAHVLARQMRRHPLMPTQPNDEAGNTSFSAVQSGLKLPASHCAFRGCCWTGTTKGSIEEHVTTMHRAQLLAAEEEVYGKGYHYGSSPGLRKSIYTLNMHRNNQALRNLFMGYYRQAIAEIERGVVIITETTSAKEMPHGLSACQGVPIVGPSVDRRTFGHLREVYNNNDICSLICFVCAQRRTHTKHNNSAIRRRHLELFKPNHSEKPAEEVLRIYTSRQYLMNLCRKTFLHRFARQGTPLWNADFLGPKENATNLTSDIRFPETDADSEVAWEWRRLYQTAEGGFWDLLCCPEDVVCTKDCNHLSCAHVGSRHIICKHCLVPVCDECHDYICSTPLQASPMALANDNVIGYTYETILKYKVSWIEAAAAQPAWTTMMCFYIEGDRGHLLEETMFNSSHMTVFRGNVFSYHMSWEKIIDFLNRTTSDEKLALLPHDPEHLAHMVQLHLKIGSIDMAKHIKEIKVRAHVVLALGNELIKAGHEAYIKSRQSEKLSTFSARMRAAQKAFKERVQQRYPTLGTPEDIEGVVPPAVLKKIEEVQAKQKQGKALIQDKHATPAEGAAPMEDVFQGARPQSLVEERTSDAGMDVAGQRTEILRQFTPLEVKINADYVTQFRSLYPSQVFPFSFPYMVGGPEYFSRSEDSRRAISCDVANDYHKQFELAALPESAKVPSRLWTAGIARRIEAQLQADWALIPALRN